MKHDYEFAIRKTHLKSGKEIHTPVCREKGFFKSKWVRILKLYEKYLLMDIEWDPELSYQDCEQHIEGFIKQTNQRRANDVTKIELCTPQMQTLEY